MVDRWQTLLAVDFDRPAAATYRANFPGVRVECGPVADFIPTLPDADVIVGGPPCQPHSHAGKRQASKDARDCGPDFVAAVAKAKPRMFLMENVPGLLSSEDGRYFQRLYAAMEDAGYVLQYRVQDAVDFGVPQFRQRLWVWGIRRDLYVDGMRHAWPVPTHTWPPPQGAGLFGAAMLPGVTVRQALGLPGLTHNPRRIDGAAGWSGQRIIGADEPSPAITGEGNNPEFIEYRVMGGGCPPVVEYRWSDAYRAKHPPINPDEPCQTVVGQWHKGEPNGCLMVGPSHIRRLTPVECLRLQSGPDAFVWPEKISKTNMYKVIGNGWSSLHAYRFSEAFAQADPDSRTVVDLFCGGGLGATGWHGRHWTYRHETKEVA